MGMRSTVTLSIVFATILGAAGCGLVFSTDCFDGTCSPARDASLDTQRDVQLDAAKDVGPDTRDTSVLDAADTAPPTCEHVDLCNVKFPANTNFCGQAPGGYPGTPGCVYYCLPSNVPCTKWCPEGCDVANGGVDHCHNQAAYQCP